MDESVAESYTMAQWLAHLPGSKSPVVRLDIFPTSLAKCVFGGVKAKQMVSNPFTTYRVIVILDHCNIFFRLTSFLLSPLCLFLFSLFLFSPCIKDIGEHVLRNRYFHDNSSYFDMDSFTPQVSADHAFDVDDSAAVDAVRFDIICSRVVCVYLSF